jgi:hypothetical protein
MMAHPTGDDKDSRSETISIVLPTEAGVQVSFFNEVGRQFTSIAKVADGRISNITLDGEHEFIATVPMHPNDARSQL